MRGMWHGSCCDIEHSTLFERIENSGSTTRDVAICAAAAREEMTLQGSKNSGRHGNTKWRYGRDDVKVSMVI